MIALLSTLIYRGDVRMEKEFKNGDIVRVTDDKRSLKCVSKHVKAGDKGIVVGDGYEDIPGLCKEAYIDGKNGVDGVDEQ